MTFQPAQFKMSDAQINSFRRWVKKPMDCVINALELIGALDGRNADLMRIAAGDKGLQKDQIENVFTYLFPSNKWDFFGYSDIKKLEHYTMNIMDPGHVIFCGYYGHNASVNAQIGHVFLIGKDASGIVKYMDPQIGAHGTICDLRNPACYSHIENKSQYFILQYSGKSGLVGGKKRRKKSAKKRRSPRRRSSASRLRRKASSRSRRRRRMSGGKRRRSRRRSKRKASSRSRRRKKWNPSSYRKRLRSPCFLDANQKKYPVCDREGKMTCKGLSAARKRATLVASTKSVRRSARRSARKVEKRATRLQKKMKCGSKRR